MQIIKNPEGMEGLVRIIDDNGVICTIRPDFVGAITYDRKTKATSIRTAGEPPVNLYDFTGVTHDTLCRILLMDEDEVAVTSSIGRINYIEARNANNPT